MDISVCRNILCDKPHYFCPKCFEILHINVNMCLHNSIRIELCKKRPCFDTHVHCPGIGCCVCLHINIDL